VNESFAWYSYLGKSANEEKKCDRQNKLGKRKTKIFKGFLFCIILIPIAEAEAK
jgi:hypothetical protein